jgi:hypothetical protein
MRTDANATTRESLTSKSFRAPSTNPDHPQPEFSGFGVRVLAAHKHAGQSVDLDFRLSGSHALSHAFASGRLFSAASRAAAAAGFLARRPM